MNILQMLKDDHDKVKELLQEISATTKQHTKQRKTLLEQLKNELLIHEDIEENILYPSLKKDAKDMVLEAFEEHHLIDELIENLEDTPTKDERWEAKLKVTCENILHHVTEEEEELFPKAREILSNEMLKKMGDEAQQHKQM